MRCFFKNRILVLKTGRASAPPPLAPHLNILYTPSRDPAATTGIFVSRRSIGTTGERIALQYFLRNGFALVRKNYYIRGGEVDLILRSGELLIFVEVKWRRNDTYGIAAESITWKKQQRLRHTVAHYLMQHPHPGPIRVDAFFMDGPLQHLRITHLRGIG